MIAELSFQAPAGDDSPLLKRGRTLSKYFGECVLSSVGHTDSDDAHTHTDSDDAPSQSDLGAWLFLTSLWPRRQRVLMLLMLHMPERKRFLLQSG